ncbi:DUF1206 domain-containing protein [Candidatus Babeliales bacterium]|nr:DUF1206 domain-containing protein [Candidatus Babeliales bacterium]
MKRIRVFAALFFISISMVPSFTGVIEKTYINVSLNGHSIRDGQNLVVGQELLGLNEDGNRVKVKIESVVEHITPNLIRIRTKEEDGVVRNFHASPQQLFYDPIQRDWFEAQHLGNKNFLLGINGEILPIFMVQIQTKFYGGRERPRWKEEHYYKSYALTLSEPKTLFLREEDPGCKRGVNAYSVLTHNGEPCVIGALTLGAALGGGSATSLGIGSASGLLSGIGLTAGFSSPAITILVIGSAGYAAYRLGKASVGLCCRAYNHFFCSKPKTYRMELLDPERFKSNTKGIKQNIDHGIEWKLEEQVIELDPEEESQFLSKSINNQFCNKNKTQTKSKKKRKKKKECEVCKLNRMKIRKGEVQKASNLEIDKNGLVNKDNKVFKHVFEKSEHMIYLLGSSTKIVADKLIKLAWQACKKDAFSTFGAQAFYGKIGKHLVGIRGFIKDNFFKFTTAFVKQKGTKMKKCPACGRVTYWRSD